MRLIANPVEMACLGPLLDPIPTLPPPSLPPHYPLSDTNRTGSCYYNGELSPLLFWVQPISH